MVETGCNQTNNQWKFNKTNEDSENDRTRFYQKIEQHDLSLLAVKNLDIFRMNFSRAGASKNENGSDMEKYFLLANRQCLKMIHFHNECCFQ